MNLADHPELRRALARRDLPTVYRLLINDLGWTQRAISEATGQRASEVSEIVRGRPVVSYDLLVRIADGLGVPRGWLGLAYDRTTPTEPVEGEEVDEDVQRRRFLAAAGAIVVGAPVLGDLEPLTIRDIITSPPERIGPADVRAFAATVTRLGVLDRESGGMAAREGLAATAAAGEEMLTAKATDQVRRQLRYTVSEAHRLAGWASGDVGLTDHMRWHMQRAVQYAHDDRVRLAQVLCSAADMEKHHGAPNDALKLLQLAQIGADDSRDPQAGAVLHGLSASAYLALGHADKAREQVRRSRTMFADAQPAGSLPFFAFYGPGHGLLGAVGAKLADYAAARADVIAALQTRPAYDVRCNTLDTIVLATLLIDAGEVAEGVAKTRRALKLVREVASQRVRDRLEPLERALLARRDSTCQDLAQRVHALRMPSDRD